MGADFTIHIFEDITEDDLRTFFSNALDSKYFDPSVTFYDWERACSKIARTPNVWVGEVSWLKASFMDNPNDFIPGPILAISNIMKEDLCLIDDDFITKIEYALKQPNTTDYSLNEPVNILSFLQKHKGKKCFHVSW